jgi:glycerol-3-phosphate dehydrogenase subunit C
MTIPRAPHEPPATSPSDPRYYDERDLEAELQRTFHICHECRMCVGYCGSFPELFNRVDRDVDAGRAQHVEALDNADVQAVADECWQCKLCYIKCPYTADEGAYELLDFPRLMAREKAVRARRKGVSVVDRVLGEPQLVGALGGGLLAPVSNLISRSRLLRKAGEAAVGVSAEFPLPPFAAETFPAWMRRRKPSPRAGEAGEVVLFATCYGNFNTPSVPQAAVRVLEHAGFAVLTVSETCCGMPNLDGGDVPGAVAKMRANVAALLPHARAGRKIVVAQPTCGYTMKKEWAEYLGDDDAREVAAATRDLMEFVEELRKDKKLPLEFDKGLGSVAYHAACHLRAQKIGFPGARVLGRALPDTDVRIVEACSAVDGTWGMKAKHYETGRRYAQKLCKAMAEDEPDTVVSDCGLSALRVAKENGVEVLHPIEALARAYGLRDEPTGSARDGGAKP